MRYVLELLLDFLKMLRDILAVFLVIASIGAWLSADHSSGLDWTLRIVLPICAAALAWPALRKRWMKDLVPDHLGPLVGRYFERDGMSFALVPSVDGTITRLNVYFQNRFEHAARLRVVLQSPRKFMSLRRGPAPRTDVTIECEGGAFGVYRVDWPVPTKLQGRWARIEVTACATYPGGRGRQLRRRGRAMHVDAPMGEAGRAALTLALLLVGAITRRATVKWRLPTGVSDSHSNYRVPQTEVLWRPALPTHGFPVVAPNFSSPHDATLTEGSAGGA